MGEKRIFFFRFFFVETKRITVAFEISRTEKKKYERRIESVSICVMNQPAAHDEFMKYKNVSFVHRDKQK